jgi:hypothetical protein
MPCNTIQRSEVDIKISPENRPYLLAALRTLGFTLNEQEDGRVSFFNNTGVTGTLEGSKINLMARGGVSMDSFNLNAIKRAFSGQIVMAASKKFGWTANQTSETKFAVQKRGL